MRFVSLCYASTVTLLTVNTLIAAADDQKKMSGGMTVHHFEGGNEVPVGKAEIHQPPGQPPVIIYPPSRSSTDWVRTPGGSNVAVAEWVEWQGKRACLSLTHDLIVQDAATRKVLWSDNAGAFWDTITFENRSPAGAAPSWDLLLRSRRHPQFTQPYDLVSGRKGELRGADHKPSGRPVAIRKEWSGSAGVRDEKLYRLVGSPDEWTRIRTELFGPDPAGLPAANDIDFMRETLLICYAGKTSNWNGISVEHAAENDQRLVVRLRRAMYQTLGKARVEHPYGLMVLPRRTGKPVALEYNVQNIKGGPHVWEEFTRVELQP